MIQPNELAFGYDFSFAFFGTTDSIGRIAVVPKINYGRSIIPTLCTYTAYYLLGASQSSHAWMDTW